MKFHLKLSSKTNIKNLATECLILTTSSLDSANFSKVTTDYLHKIIQSEQLDHEHSTNRSVLLFKVPGIAANRMFVLGANHKHPLSEIQFLEIIKTISNTLSKHNVSNAAFFFHDLNVKEKNLKWQLYQASLHLASNLYHFDEYKTKKSPHKQPIKYLDFIVNEKLLKNAESILQQAAAVNNACNLVKDLANTPPNVCNTNFMAKVAKELKKKSAKIKLTILEKRQLEKLKMGAFLSVAQGSLQPPKLICLEYRGGGSSTEKNPPIVLIGKGVTFDTGGNSLKSPHAMIGMKFDMCGAATVFGIINFVIEMKLNLNIVGIVATAENMPGRHASRPDDVVTTMSGMTVEILNTDAEGRLLLCDALTYCKKFNPKVVIDMATLTGSCVATFGHYYTGLFSNNQELANELIAAGNHAYDKVWQLPITEEYHKLIDSDIADIANVGGSHAGSITAACFLAKFADQYKWAHLDIAGTAYYQEGKVTRHPSGRCLPMLAAYLMKIAE